MKKLTCGKVPSMWSAPLYCEKHNLCFARGEKYSATNALQKVMQLSYKKKRYQKANLSRCYKTGKSQKEISISLLLPQVVALCDARTS